MNADNPFADDRFPRASAYHPEWIVATAGGGANSLWLTEWLTSKLELKPGMTVLDLGCGLAASSIFLARECGVKVWATDLWISAFDNLRRIRDAGCEGNVYPIHADARSLPYAAEFFDVVVSIDSFPYYGTDDHYLAYLARLLKPGGVLAIAGAGHMQELQEPLPDHLHDWWKDEPGMWCLHSAAWWRRHWERTGIVDVEVADTMPDGWRYWLRWHQAVAPQNLVEIQAVEKDQGKYLGYVRVIARRRAGVRLDEPVTSVPTEYVKKPLLHGPAN
jgi:SAM-dependent methyltransferase